MKGNFGVGEANRYYMLDLIFAHIMHAHFRFN